MWRLIGLAILFFIAASLTAVVLLFKKFGFAGLPGLFLALVVLAWVGKYVAAFLLSRALTLPFVAKGKVLRDAKVTVHAIEPAPRPVVRMVEGEEPDPEQEAEDLKRQFFYVDVTISPKPAADGGFQLWEPGELVIAGPRAKARPSESENDDDELGDVYGLRLWRDGVWAEDLDYKYQGEQRLRLHVGLKKIENPARLRYYFELLGALHFPETAKLLPPHAAR